MSVAYELFPCEYPQGEDGGACDAVVRQLAAHHRPLASVSVLHAPVAEEFARPLRLTRRGQLVIGLVVAALGAAFVWLAAGSAPTAVARPHGPVSVTVQPGDTLWSIASRMAPQSDPREVVQRLQEGNHLGGAQLMPGEVLSLH